MRLQPVIQPYLPRVAQIFQHLGGPTRQLLLCRALFAEVG